jgi:hypothetical protein
MKNSARKVPLRHDESAVNVAETLEDFFYEYHFVVFSHAAEAIGSPVAAEVVKGQS